MLRLNPYAAVLKRQAILATEKRQLKRDEALAKARGVSTILIFFLTFHRYLFSLHSTCSRH